MQVLRSGGERLPSRTRPYGPYVLPLVAAIVAAATTLDVVAGGPLRRFDDWIFAGGLPPRTGAWHWFWRTIVNGGQYWLVGTGAALAALWAAWRIRDRGWPRVLWLLATAAAWLVGTELVIRAAQVGFGRTPPRTGADHMFQDGFLSYPSGHAANGAACWIFILAVLGASRRWTIAVHALVAAVAVAVVALGYHWPTDAIAGWGLGVLLGCAGRALVLGWAGSQRAPDH